MKNLKTFLVAATAIMTASFGISAQQDDKRFQGLYGGVEAGYDRSEFNPLSGDDSFYYGLNLGYRYQTNSNWVLGLEGSFGKSEFDIDLPFQTSPQTELGSDFQWSASGILGYAADDNLFFTKLGIAGNQIEVEGGGPLLDDTVLQPFEDNFHEEGLLLGVGYERAISDRLSFSVGFDYVTYGNGFEQYQPKAGIKLKF